MDELERDTISGVFDRFVEAFGSFDARRVSALFAVPCVALKPDNSLVAFADKADVEAYFDNVLDHHVTQGCTGARYFDLEISDGGPLATMATLTWDLTSEAGQVLSRWRQSYHLKLTAEGPKIFATTFIAY